VLAELLEAAAVTAPVFALLLLGRVLFALGWIDDAFARVATNLVFKATLPTLLFLSMLRAQFDVGGSVRLLAFFTLATLVSFAGCWAWARWRIGEIDRDVYVQGAFRGNCAIVGLALAASSFGPEGLAIGGVLLAAVILLYNVLAIIVLAWYHGDRRTLRLTTLLRDVARNPLMIAIVCAVPVRWVDPPIPGWLLAAADDFAAITLPLALTCIGAGLTLTSLREARGPAVSASLAKCVWIPLAGTLAAAACGFRDAELGVLFLYMGCPSAVASYVMARGYGANHELAAAIVATSTLLSMLTITIGLGALRAFGGT